MASSAAPGALEQVRAFINTVEIEETTDPLHPAHDSLAQWCEETDLCRQADERALADLRAFREALRAVLEANAGEGESAERWRALEPFAARTGYTMSITPAGTPALRPLGSGADAAIGALLAIVYNAIAEGTWPRLKACRKHSCRWAFYDRSKNGSGAWCSMRVCGNRAKAQRRRAREKSHGIR
jgi:predicted RNA-binding Zn ribbon-like protein